jgi:hypothetical protein
MLYAQRIFGDIFGDSKNSEKNGRKISCWTPYVAAHKTNRFYWRPGTQNFADYWMKHHPKNHHKSFRPLILTSATDPEYQKLTIPRNIAGKAFIKKLLLTPQFAKQIIAKQKMLTAQSA